MHAHNGGLLLILNVCVEETVVSITSHSDFVRCRCELLFCCSSLIQCCIVIIIFINPTVKICEFSIDSCNLGQGTQQFCDLVLNSLRLQLIRADHYRRAIPMQVTHAEKCHLHDNHKL